MKVWEALEILEGLDPNVEVMLTIGKARKPMEPEPYWRYAPEFRFPSTPAMPLPQYPEPRWTVTCNTQYEN